MEKSNKIIAHHGGYRTLLSFGFVNLIYHATMVFCERNYNYKNDPLGKSRGQMEGAARSARQNIVEASTRAGTSCETELRLLDVAKGSLQELAGDYEVYIGHIGELPWDCHEESFVTVKNMELDRFRVNDFENQRREFALWLKVTRQRFSGWLENENPYIAANAQLIIIDRASALLHRQVEWLTEKFVENGGMTERMSKARIEFRKNQSEEQASRGEVPSCPLCGKPMRVHKASRGVNVGKRFWGCIGYPECKGTRRID